MDSFIFYKSFYDAAKDLPAKQRGIFYDYIVNYAITGEEPTKNSIENTLFKLVKPQIDANKKRRENGEKGGKYGSLGGRPKKEKNPIGVIEENPKGVKDKTPNVNVNVNNNENENVKENLNKERKEIINKEDEFLKNCLDDTYYLDVLKMNHKLSGNCEDALREFNSHCAEVEQKHETLREYKQHFSNWLIRRNQTQPNNKTSRRYTDEDIKIMAKNGTELVPKDMTEDQWEYIYAPLRAEYFWEINKRNIEEQQKRQQ